MSRLWGSKKGKVKGEMCGFCRVIIVKDKTHSGMFYSVTASAREEGGKIHTECWEAYHEKTAPKCLHCQGPVAQLPGRFSGKHYVSNDPPGKVHSECWEEYQGSKPPTEKCSQCGEPLSGVGGKFSGNYMKLEGDVKVHVECRKAYHAAHTIKCLHCSEPVAPEKGKFSGEFFEVEGGGRVHGECFEEYSEATADKCLVCKGAVRKKEGFSGDFMIVDNGKVHKECASDYQEMVSSKCLYCGKGVRKTGEFSGAFYPVDRKLGDAKGEENEARVHLECWEAYEAKLAAERERSSA